jgi:hypothetical protein
VSGSPSESASVIDRITGTRAPGVSFSALRSIAAVTEERRETLVASAAAIGGCCSAGAQDASSAYS